MKYFLIMTILIISSAGLIMSNDDSTKEITAENVKNAQLLIDLNLTDSEIDSLLDDAHDNLAGYKSLHQMKLNNATAPVLQFNPLPVGFQPDITESIPVYSPIEEVTRPERFDDIAFYSIPQLAHLLKTGQVTSVELTTFFIDRLKKFDPVLHCVITMTEERAMQRAQQADREISAGNYKGLLHGIPYGAKDLLAVKGYPTTWGANPYKDQSFDYDAEIIKRLDSAGAVLIAKLSLGALAWGDVWFGDTTRNPWNTEQGSSGSSAGSASAVAAGLVPFAIGSETWGSIVSPSTRCGSTGLRPTFGRVSRTGAMALSWSMDKLGPLARSVEDCAIVFDAIRGVETKDQSTIEAGFGYNYDVDLKDLKIGYLKSAFDEDTTWTDFNQSCLDKLTELGAELIPIELPAIPVDGLPIILSAEAAAAFDELTRSDSDDLLVRQVKNAWPNVFRSSRFIPAVEYINANRVRSLLIDEMNNLMSEIDVYVTPPFGGNNLLMNNLTGHPCVVMPNGFTKENTPVSITFIGKLFDEATLVAVANKYEQATGYNRLHPDQFR